jgi:hypothetical protein
MARFESIRFCRERSGGIHGLYLAMAWLRGLVPRPLSKGKLSRISAATSAAYEQAHEAASWETELFEDEATCLRLNFELPGHAKDCLWVQ